MSRGHFYIRENTATCSLIIAKKLRARNIIRFLEIYITLQKKNKIKTFINEFNTYNLSLLNSKDNH